MKPCSLRELYLRPMSIPGAACTAQGSSPLAFRPELHARFIAVGELDTGAALEGRSRRDFRLRRKLPRRDLLHNSVKPRKSRVSGFPRPRFSRLAAAWRPNSISRVLPKPEPRWKDQARDNCEDHKEEGPYNHGKPSHGRS